MKPMHRRNVRRRNSGFTLVEMIVAALLLIIGAVAALNCISNATKTTAMANDLTTASLLGPQKLAELEADPTQLTSDQSGDFGDNYPGWRWEANIETIDVPDVVKVTVTVLWGRGASERTAEFITYLSNAPSPNTSTGTTTGTTGTGQ